VRWRPTKRGAWGLGFKGLETRVVPPAGGREVTRRVAYTARAFVGVYDGLTSAGTRGGNDQVVSLATGTQCAGADRLQRDALTLHDSHAEALARRALVAALQADVQTLLQVSFCGVSLTASGVLEPLSLE